MLCRATPWRWLALLLTLLLAPLLVAAPVFAQPVAAKTATYTSAADIPVSVFFQLPSYSQMAMSPDGKKLAALAPANGRENLVVIDLETRQSTRTTTFSTVGGNWFVWVDDGRLIFRA